MEIEKSAPDKAASFSLPLARPGKGTFETDFEEDPETRVKSSLRLQYEAQVRVIQQQIGSLEKARENLGLSQRKMAQLLLVDPSAWTRWTKPGAEAPPHIWRALQWYLTVREKIPGLTPQYFLHSMPENLAKKGLQDLKVEKEARERQVLELKKRLVEIEGGQIEILALKEQTKLLRRWNFALSILALMLAAGLFWLI